MRNEGWVSNRSTEEEPIMISLRRMVGAVHRGGSLEEASEETEAASETDSEAAFEEVSEVGIEVILAEAVSEEASEVTRAVEGFVEAEAALEETKTTGESGTTNSAIRTTSDHRQALPVL